jgi:hypothetical protein
LIKHVFHKRPEPYNITGFLFSALNRYDLRNSFARFALAYLTDETKGFAFLDAASIPQTDPAAPLLSDTSYRVPYPHNHFSLCVFAASFWRWIQIIIRGLVALDPYSQSFTTNESSPAETDSGNGRAVMDAAGDHIRDVGF